VGRAHRGETGGASEGHGVSENLLVVGVRVLCS
jgi:hypothetical protein